EIPVGARHRGAVDVVEGPGRGATGERPVRGVELPHTRLDTRLAGRPARHPDDVVGVIHVRRGRDDVHARRARTGAAPDVRPQDFPGVLHAGRRAVPPGAGGHVAPAAV